MIQCRACECVQIEGDMCRRCGREFKSPAIPGLPVEVVQPKQVEMPKPPRRPRTLADLEEEVIRKTLKRYTPNDAARILGIGHTKLYRKIKEYGIEMWWQEQKR